MFSKWLAIVTVRLSGRLTPIQYRAWRALLAHDEEQFRRGLSPVRAFGGHWHDVARIVAHKPESFSQQTLQGGTHLEAAANEVSNFLDKTGGYSSWPKHKVKS
jgi:hypothetical protein